MTYPLMKRATATSVTRFLDAQSGAYPRIVREITTARKRTHWMWFVFPQLKALAKSETAHYYGIADRAEAVAYLDDPTLRARLAECTLGVLAHPKLMLTYPDNHKLRSCMTLFSRAAVDPTLANAVLAKFFDGKPDQLTLDVLAGKAIALPPSRAPMWHQTALPLRSRSRAPSGDAMDRGEVAAFLREFNLSRRVAERIAEEWLADRRRAVSVAWDEAYDSCLG